MIPLMDSSLVLRMKESLVLWSIAKGFFIESRPESSASLSPQRETTAAAGQMYFHSISIQKHAGNVYLLS
jgi:hypothetical protein